MTLDDDVAAAVDRVRIKRSIGVSAAVNDLIRAGLVARKDAEPFVQKTSPGGLRIDVRDIATALDVLESDGRR